MTLLNVKACLPFSDLSHDMIIFFFLMEILRYTQNVRSLTNSGLISLLFWDGNIALIGSNIPEK
jgi:hypothetical protein